MTTATTSPDNRTDSSDLLSMLGVIEQLYAVSRTVISSHSAAAVLLSLAVEVQTLLTKLRAMRQRWSVHLPFKEASSVDFVDWCNRMARLSHIVSSADSRHCLDPLHGTPSSHCLLDLYKQTSECAADGTGEGDMTDPKQLLSHHTAIQDRLTAQREKCVDAISQMISGHFTSSQGLSLCELATVRTVCSGLLSELSEELSQLHELQVKIFTAEDYERLADRILYEAEYEGPIARREARDIMHCWRNGVPAGKLEKSRKEQIELTKEEIRHTRHGVKLEQYVNLDADFYSQRSEFGKFLFNRRRDITRAELRQLIQLVYCVYYYQTDGRQEPGQPAGVTPTPGGAPDEDNPTLPADFLPKLRDNQAAVISFIRILRQVEPYINKSSATVPDSTPELRAHYKDWTWYHLKTAFEQSGFLPNNSSAASFGKFIHSLFPHRTESSVTRALYRNTNLNSRNIVADVVKEFSDVWK